MVGQTQYGLVVTDFKYGKGSFFFFRRETALSFALKMVRQKSGVAVSFKRFLTQADLSAHTAVAQMVCRRLIALAPPWR